MKEHGIGAICIQETWDEGDVFDEEINNSEFSAITVKREKRTEITFSDVLHSFCHLNSTKYGEMQGAKNPQPLQKESLREGSSECT